MTMTNTTNTAAASGAANLAQRIDANALEAMAKERPDDMFLKGTGVLKLTSAIRQLEGENRRLHAALAAPAQAVPAPGAPPEGFVAAEAYDRLHDHAESLAERILALNDKGTAAAPAQAAPLDAAAQQDAGAFNLGFNAGICLALQVLRGFGDTDSAAWREILKAAGRKEVENYAKNIETENWELCGFAHIATLAAEDAA